MLLQEGGKVVCVILVYVDDLIMMGPAAEVDALCKQVSERFQCTVPVALSYSVTTIGWDAFEGCSSLKTLEIPSGSDTIQYQ